MTPSRPFRRFLLVAAGFAAGGLTVAALTLDVLLRADAPPAGPLTVRWLEHRCRPCAAPGRCPAAEGLACEAFVAGVLAGRPAGLTGLCLPRALGPPQARALFLAWAARHPEAALRGAGDGVVAALRSSFDCRHYGGGV